MLVPLITAKLITGASVATALGVYTEILNVPVPTAVTLGMYKALATLFDFIDTTTTSVGATLELVTAKIV